jgi:hypothetical protein
MGWFVGRARVFAGFIKQRDNPDSVFWAVANGV